MTIRAPQIDPTALPPALLFHDDFFLSMLGLERDAPLLATAGAARHATRAYRPALGITEGAYYRIKCRPDGGLALKVKYWNQDAGMANACPNIVDLDFAHVEIEGAGRFYYLKSGDFLGRSLDAAFCADPARVRAVLAACQEMLGGIAENNHHIPDIPAIAARYGLEMPSGGLQTLFAKRTYSKPAPVGRFRFLVPRWFFPALLGIGPDAHGYSGKAVRHSQTVAGEGGAALLQRGYVYQVTSAANRPFAARLHASVTRLDTATGTRHDHELVDLHITQAAEHKDLYEITLSSLLGQDWRARFAKLRVGNEDAYAHYSRALRFVSRLTRLCRADAAGMAVLERQAESTLTDILHHNGVYDLVRQEAAPPYYKKGMASTFRQLGGATERRVLDDRETGIGSNAKKHGIAYGNSRGRVFRRALLVDGGSTFLENGLMTADLARHFRHTARPDDAPVEEVLAWVLTHGHADHVDLVAYVVKSGYRLPPLVLTPLTLEYVTWKLRDLKVPTSEIHAIRDSAVRVDFDVAESGTRRIGDVVVSRTTETLVDAGHPAGVLHCPRLTLRAQGDPVDAFALRCGPAGHSLPGLMLDVITRDAQGRDVTTRHSSDVKMDDTGRAGHPTSRAWLSAHAADYLCLESTNAARAGRAADMADISAELADLIVQGGAGKRHNFGLFASKLDQMIAVFDALACARRRLVDAGAPPDTLSVCVMDGQNMVRSARNLNKVGLPLFVDTDPSDKAKLKHWLAQTHGITLLLATDKAAKELYETGRMGSYARLVTGPNDEPMSTLYRESRDMLERNQTRGPDDVYYDLQGRIPVGDVPVRKRALKSRLVNEHGVTVHDADGYFAETGRRIAESGHGCADDLREIIMLSRARVVVSEHGSRAQRDALAELAAGAGAAAPVLAQDAVYALDGNGRFEPQYPVPEQRLYIDDFDAGAFGFLNREDYQINPLALPPRLHTPLGDALDAFEHAQGQVRGAGVHPQPVRHHPLRITEQADGGAEATVLSAFGIETGRYDEAAIHTWTGMDHEATDAVYPYSFECAFASYDPDGTPRETQVFEQVLPREAVVSPGAVYVTRRDPRDLHAPADPARGRLDPPAYAAALSGAIDALVRKKTVRDAANRTRRVADGDALLVLHNARYDLGLTAKELFWNGYMQDRPWMQKGIVVVDTLHLARMIHALQPDALNVVYDADSRHPSFRLEDVCRANGVAYDTAAAHGAAHDAHAAVAFFRYCRDVAPDIVAQYLWLVSDHGRTAKKQMLGISAPHDAPRPVVACVAMRGGQVTARPGVLIRVTDGGRTGIFANPQYDLPALLARPDEDIAAMLRDRGHDVFFTMPLDGRGLFAPLSLAAKAMPAFDIHPAVLAEREKAVRDARVARRLARLVRGHGNRKELREVYDDHLIDRKMQVYARARRYRGLIRESGQIVRYFNVLAKGIRTGDLADVTSLAGQMDTLPDPDARDVARKLVDRFGRAAGIDLLPPDARARQDAANAWEANGPAEAPNMTTARARREWKNMTGRQPRTIADGIRAWRLQNDPHLVRIFEGYAGYLDSKRDDPAIALTDDRTRLHAQSARAARKNRLFNNLG